MTQKKKNNDTIICFEECTKSVFVPLDNIKTVPFEISDKDIRNLLSFFLYRSPGVESIHSKIIKREKHQEIYDEMFRERHFVYKKICSSNTIIDKELQKGHVEGNKICLKCKRFVLKREKTQKGHNPETDLDCILRHIRNSIAHGRVYYRKDRNRIHFVFEDCNKKNLTARIVCIKSDLEFWKKVLSRKENYE